MTEQEILSVISSNPRLLSMLYDINMLPEQLKRDSKEWVLMEIITIAFNAGKEVGAEAKLNKQFAPPIT